MTTTKNMDWWWIAINGASCAASPVPLPDTLEVSPIPAEMLGFRTQEEQLAAQKLLLTAPMDEVRRFQRAIGSKIRTGEVVLVKPEGHEPPTTGTTFWCVKPNVERT